MGLFTLSAASLGYHVVAFEPASSNVKRIHAALHVNGLSHLVEVEQAALGIAVGVQWLYLNDESTIFKSNGILIPQNSSTVFDHAFHRWARGLTKVQKEGPWYQPTLTRTLDDWYARSRTDGRADGWTGGPADRRTGGPADRRTGGPL